MSAGSGYVRLRDYAEEDGGPASLADSRDSRDASSSPRVRSGMGMNVPIISPGHKDGMRPHVSMRQKKGRSVAQ